MHLITWLVPKLLQQLTRGITRLLNTLAFDIAVINWLNKQINDQMMSQQRLGPFEMHTKTVSPRGPPLVPYNKVHRSVWLISWSTLHEMVIFCVAFCCFYIQVTSTTVGSSSAGNRTDIPRYTEPAQVNFKVFSRQGTFRVCLKTKTHLNPTYELVKLQIQPVGFCLN